VFSLFDRFTVLSVCFPGPDIFPAVRLLSKRPITDKGNENIILPSQLL